MIQTAVARRRALSFVKAVSIELGSYGAGSGDWALPTLAWFKRWEL